MSRAEKESEREESEVPLRLPVWLSRSDARRREKRWRAPHLTEEKTEVKCCT